MGFGSRLLRILPEDRKLYRPRSCLILWPKRWPSATSIERFNYWKPKGNSGFRSDKDFFLLTYLYCVKGSVEKAEALAAAKALPREKDSFVDWLWGKLQAEYGFRPPG